VELQSRLICAGDHVGGAGAQPAFDVTVGKPQVEERMHAIADADDGIVACHSHHAAPIDYFGTLG
jgi:hypothetical protein